MAVGADQLAFGYLIEYRSAAAVGAEPSNVGPLGGAGKVIPLHRGRMKSPAAVGTRTALKTLIPIDESMSPLVFLPDPNLPSTTVVGSVVHLAAALAPRLPSTARGAMKL
jgi:hypothetical protein